MKSNHSKTSFYGIKCNVICSILFCLVHVISFGQANSIKKEDFKFYYVFDSKLMDVRTHKPVLPNLKLDGIPVYFTENNILSIYTGFNNFNYDSFGKNISSFTNTVEYHYKIKSPDYKQHLYTKEKDIWVEKINYSNGKSYDEKRLTQLGIFQSIYIINWFEENVIFGTQMINNKKIYSINIVSGDLAEINMDKKNERVFQEVKGDYMSRNVHTNYDFRSPSGRYFLVLSNNEPDYVYDMKTLTKKDLTYDMTNLVIQPYWASDTIALVYSSGYLFWVNVKTTEVGNIVQYIDGLQPGLTAKSSVESKILCEGISLNGSYMAIPRRISEQSNQKSLIKMAILDFSKKEFIDPEIAGTVNWGASNPDWLNYKWVSDTKVIYKSEGDITTQGTWIYDVAKKEKKKLTGFLLRDVVVLQKVNKVVFMANDYLFSMDTNGDNLEQISKTQVLYKWGLSDFDFLGIAEELKNLPVLKIDYSQTNMNFSIQSKPISNNFNEVVKKPSNNVAEKKTKLPNLSNGNFNTKEGWNTTNGEAIFEKGKVALTPDKNSIPVKLFSNAFSIPTNSRQLKLKVAKNLVGKGEIKISLQNTTTNTTEDIYKDKINNLGSKIGNVLLNANKALDGNLNFKKIEPTFEVITVDISRFAGTTVILELYFTNTGSSKQPVVIDEIIVN